LAKEIDEKLWNAELNYDVYEFLIKARASSDKEEPDSHFEVVVFVFCFVFIVIERFSKTKEIAVFITDFLKALRKSARCGPSAGSSLSIRGAFCCYVFLEKQRNNIISDEMRSNEWFKYVLKWNQPLKVSHKRILIAQVLKFTYLYSNKDSFTIFIIKCDIKKQYGTSFHYFPVENFNFSLG